MNDPIIAVFRGGDSAEREVSQGSGAAALAALRGMYPRVVDCEVADRRIPDGIDAGTHVVFTTLHGVFGEDGMMQELLEQRGIAYCGCDAISSRVCFNKQRSKEVATRVGVPVAKGFLVKRDDASRAEAMVRDLGSSLVVKPNCQGSSVGLTFVRNAAELAQRIAEAGDDGCVVEEWVRGRELTVGVLDGRAMGVVEIRPRSGHFDYASKYTKGLTEYFAPAPIDEALASSLRQYSEAVFEACGCRDFARVDFMLGDGGPVFLEINTLPGLKETSLLPMSARCVGFDFPALVRRMIEPAIGRFRAAASTPVSPRT